MRKRAYSTVFAAIGLCVVTTACKSEDAGKQGLMVALTSDMQIPKDVTHVGVQVVTASGETKLERWYELGESPNQQLPGTLGVAPGKSDETVTIRIYARQNDDIKSIAEAITKVPRDRTAMLRVPIEWLSTGMVESSASSSDTSSGGAAADSSFPINEEQQLFAGTVTSCGTGKTAKLGSCVSSKVDSTTLPDYDPAAIFGGGTGDGDGSCFDTVGCFETQTGMEVDDWDKCRAVLSSGDDFDAESMSLGLVTAEGAGLCGSGGCVVPLDWASSDGDSGYTVSGGKVLLPTAVCDRLNAGSIRAVVASTDCASKTASVPVCGPWSSAGAGTGEDVATSDRLAQCKTFVATACDTMRRCGTPPASTGTSFKTTVAARSAWGTSVTRA